MASIKPEYLMEPQEYRTWMRIQRQIEAHKNKSGHRSGLRAKTVEEETIEDQLFEAVSKRAWTDVLLQLLKVCLNCLKGYSSLGVLFLSCLLDRHSMWPG